MPNFNLGGYTQMADMLYRDKYFRDKRFNTIQEVLNSGEASVELYDSEVESICKNLGIEKYESVIVRYKEKLFYVDFASSDCGYDTICVFKRDLIDVTD